MISNDGLDDKNPLSWNIMFMLISQTCYFQCTKHFF